MARRRSFFRFLVPELTADTVSAVNSGVVSLAAFLLPTVPPLSFGFSAPCGESEEEARRMARRFFSLRSLGPSGFGQSLPESCFGPVCWLAPLSALPAPTSPVRRPRHRRNAV